MSQEALVHVINKANTTEHHTIHTDTSSLPTLAQGNVRVQTRLVGLTANNLTYARHASIGNWWNAFPVPPFLPPPYNDTTKYGIVPVWGYGEIVASRVSGLEIGAVLYGYWPSSSLPVDLHLEAAGQPEGHYNDTTPHRQTNWAFYHRYILISGLSFKEDLTSPTLAAETIFKPVFECAYTLNAYVLGPRALNPAPESSTSSSSWSLKEEDLTNAVFISLAASGKTARAFNDAVLNDRRASLPGPQAFVAVTSNPATFSLPLPKHDSNTTTHHISTLVLSYEAALSQEEEEDKDTLTSFLASLPSNQPISRIVIVDFGARGNCTEDLVARLRSYFRNDNSSRTEERISVVGIGSEPAPARISTTATAEKMSRLAAAAAGTTTSSIPPQQQQQVFKMNTCEVREALIEELGASAYFASLAKAWEGFVARGGCRDAKVEIGRGVKELEVGWRRLCAGEAARVGGLAYLL